MQWNITQPQNGTFESVLMGWIYPEPTEQSEVSQKNKYHILIYILYTYLYGIYKDGTDEPICRAAMEMQT